MSDEMVVADSSFEPNLPAAVQAPAATLFQTSDPISVIDRATKVAEKLSGVIKKQRLYADIRGKAHVTVSGWTLCGSMLGVFPVTVWTRKLENGFEARVEARTLNGSVIGAAEAQCLTSEKQWSNREDFALRSMAQTRATSKAMRMPLGFIMQLAGFDATPAEEMSYMKGEVSQPIKAPKRKEVVVDVEPTGKGVDEMVQHFASPIEASSEEGPYEFPTYFDKATKEQVQLSEIDYTPMVVDKLDTYEGNTNGKPWTIYKYTFTDSLTNATVRASGFSKTHAEMALVHNPGLGAIGLEGEVQLLPWKQQTSDNAVGYVSVAITPGRPYKNNKTGEMVETFDLRDLTIRNVNG
tara:strand:- start:13200 stop:14255 length:1056 start_codon:yes stop_codon:yes gene_type:complete